MLSSGALNRSSPWCVSYLFSSPPAAGGLGQFRVPGGCRMIRLCSLVAICLAAGLIALSPSGRADDRKKADAAKTAKADPAKELAAIEKEGAEAQAAFGKAYQEVKTHQEHQQVLKEKRPKAAPFAERCLKLAETHPDSPAAAKALFWVLANARDSEAGKKALVTLKDSLVARSDLDQLHATL